MAIVYEARPKLVESCPTPCTGGEIFGRINSISGSLEDLEKSLGALFDLIEPIMGELPLEKEAADCISPHYESELGKKLQGLDITVRNLIYAVNRKHDLVKL